MTPRAFFLAALCAVVAACGDAQQRTAPTFHAEGLPERLSDWGVISTHGGVVTLAEATMPYDIATPLFSDYAAKLRTVSLPAGEKASIDSAGSLVFPVGTIISKTFYYPVSEDGAVLAEGGPTFSSGTMPLNGVRLIETRILARRAEGWLALSYVWSDDQRDAVLKRTGAMAPLRLQRPDGRLEAFAYIVPNQNQCAGCHITDLASRAVEPIGLKTRHLDKPSRYQAGLNQLEHWRLAGLFDVRDHRKSAANAVWDDASASLDDRARAYLDANCSHCHNPAGPAKTSGLNLLPDAEGPALGRCKAPIAAGRGAGGRLYSIVPGEPDESILLFRMESNDPSAMMPELGRAVVHEEAVALIRAWITGMQGGCT